MADRDKQKERMWEDNRLSEDEKKMRNPLYKKARESYMRMVLPAMAAWIPFVIVLMYLLDTAENKKLDPCASSGSAASRSDRGAGGSEPEALVGLSSLPQSSAGRADAVYQYAKIYGLLSFLRICSGGEG